MTPHTTQTLDKIDDKVEEVCDNFQYGLFFIVLVFLIFVGINRLFKK